MRELLKDLEELLYKHNAGFAVSYAWDGIHFKIVGEFNGGVEILEIPVDLGEISRLDINQALEEYDEKKLY